MLSFLRQLADRTESSSSSTFLRKAGLNASSGMGEGSTAPRGIGDGVIRAQRAIGLDLHRQFVVVENLTFARILDPVRYLAHRRVKTIHRDQSDRRILWPIALCGHIALSGVDRELHPDLGALVQGAQNEVGVEQEEIAG